MSLSIIKYPSGGGGGSTSRFGFAGEDATAGENRSFDLNGNTFSLTDGVDVVVSVDKTTDTYWFGDIAQTYFYNDAAGFEISSGGVPSVGMNVMDFTFGDYNATQNKTYLDVDDTNQIIRFFFGNDPYLKLDFANNDYVFGDAVNFNATIGSFLTGTFNGVYLNAAWPATGATAYMGADVGAATNQPNIYNIINVGGVGSNYILDPEKFYVQHGSAYNLDLNWTTNRYRLGDIAAPTALLNGTVLEVDDTNNLVKISNTANTASIQINGSTGFTGIVSPVNSITVVGGIIVAAS